MMNRFIFTLIALALVAVKVKVSGNATCGETIAKVGTSCYSDNVDDRALPDLLLSGRADGVKPPLEIDWNNYNTWLPYFICQCATKACENGGYSHIGIQFYGECWAGNGDGYKKYGVADAGKCVNGTFQACRQSLDPFCAGMANTNMVYELHCP